MPDIDDEPAWAQTLHVIYEKDMQEDILEKDYGELEQCSVIADELSIEPDDISNLLINMRGMGLIEKKSSQESRYMLTKKGFDVVHTRALRRHEQRMEDSRNRRQHSVNRAIGYLTLGLVLMGYIQATITALVGKYAPLWQVNGVLVIGVFVAVGLAVLLFQSGLLSTWDTE